MVVTMPRVRRRSGITRRSALKALAAMLPHRASSQTHPTDWPAPILAYLQRLARPDGGYAWEDQDESHLTPTFAVIGCHHLLGRTPPDPQRLADFVRTHHPGAKK